VLIALLLLLLEKGRTKAAMTFLQKRKKNRQMLCQQGQEVLRLGIKTLLLPQPLYMRLRYPALSVYMGWGSTCVLCSSSPTAYSNA